MTLLTGCFGKSNQEIVNYFSDFISMYPTEDLTVLYDKNPDNSNLPSGDLGTWVISSYLYTSDKKDIGIVLGFNRNTREAKGNFIVKEGNNETRIKNNYSIYYDKDGIHFLDENVDESVKEDLANFNMMYNFISLNNEYIDSLKAIKFSYNAEVPMYEAKYKLTTDDINIKKIKEIYPNLTIDEDNINLNLSGDGTTWNTAARLSLEIALDETYDNRFVSSMSLSESDSFSESLEGK